MVLQETLVNLMVLMVLMVLQVLRVTPTVQKVLMAP
jgi:hypothetical protein